MKWPKMSDGLGVVLFWVLVAIILAVLKIFVIKGN